MGRPLTRYLEPLGWMLRETLRRRQMSQGEFAKRTGIPHHVLQRIIYHGKEITPQQADALAKVTGVSATTWLRLQEKI